MNNDWWNWFGWLWAVFFLQLYWVLPVVAVAAALATLTHHQHQRASWGTARRLQHDTETPGHGPGLAGATRWLILGDGLTTALRRRLARAQRQIGRLSGQLAAVEMSLVELAPAVQELRASADELGPSTAAVSPELAGKLFVALYLGDCAVAAGILMANNAQLPLILAVITSLAIATCQFAVGKLVGKALAQRHDARLTLIAPLAVLVLLGVSLAALLHHVSWSWTFLSVTPAIGAAALTVASHDPPRQQHYRAKGRLRAPRRRSLRAFRRLSRAIGRASGAWSHAAAVTTRSILAPQMAEAAAADVIVVGANLTEHVRGVDSMLDDLQALRLHGGFEEVAERLRLLLDQLAHLTAMESAAESAPPSGDVWRPPVLTDPPSIPAPTPLIPVDALSNGSGSHGPTTNGASR
jgi:hypothetical protein